MRTEKLETVTGREIESLKKNLDIRNVATAEGPYPLLIAAGTETAVNEYAGTPEKMLIFIKLNKADAEALNRLKTAVIKHDSYDGTSESIPAAAYKITEVKYSTGMTSISVKKY